MLDGGNFHSKAAKEIEEEVGIKIKESDLFNMSEAATDNIPMYPWKSLEQAPKAATDSKVPISEKIENSMYPSPGGCDEFVPLMLCQRRFTVEKINELQGKATGLRSEGEMITLKLVLLKNLWREGARDAKALAALALYRALEDEGKLPKMPEKPGDSQKLEDLKVPEVSDA
jgi:ADP-sugar diphosphatase